MQRPEDSISVSELVRRLRRAVEGIDSAPWVEGEIGALKQAASGHVYFTLKDEREDASLECVMYRLNALRARQLLSDGARIQLRGKATLWGPRGRLQLVVEAVRPLGRGALLVALEQLKLRLAAEGLFNPERKRRLPPHPAIVGVVTSAHGAALHDIRTVAFRRGGARLVLAPALVQGEGAPASLVRALDLIERYPGLEVIVIGRGGGSEQDLMAFNDERVVRRVASLRIPVVSAVGHEIDTTLTDLVADLRAATPSQAAELVIPDAAAQRNQLDRAHRALLRSVQTRVLEDQSTLDRLRHGLGDPRFTIADRQRQLSLLLERAQRHMQRATQQRRADLDRRLRRFASRHPRSVVAEAKLAIGPIRERLENALTLRLQRARARLGESGGRLHALSPLGALARGYAIVYDELGNLVRDAGPLHVGTPIRIRLHQGSLEARVTSVDRRGLDQASSGNNSPEAHAKRTHKLEDDR